MFNIVVQYMAVINLDQINLCAYYIFTNYIKIFRIIYSEQQHPYTHINNACARFDVDYYVMYIRVLNRELEYECLLIKSTVFIYTVSCVTVECVEA